MGDLKRRAAVRGDHPDLLRFLVLLQVDGLDGEGHELAVGRNLRVADARDAEESVYIEWLLLRERSGCREEQTSDSEHS
jgi:hypothetical protein